MRSQFHSSATDVRESCSTMIRRPRASACTSTTPGAPRRSATPAAASLTWGNCCSLMSRRQTGPSAWTTCRGRHGIRRWPSSRRNRSKAKPITSDSRNRLRRGPRPFRIQTSGRRRGERGRSAARPPLPRRYASSGPTAVLSRVTLRRGGTSVRLRHSRTPDMGLWVPGHRSVSDLVP